MSNELSTMNHKDEIHLRDYVQIVLRQKWVIIVSFIVSLTFVTIKSFKATHIFQATTQVKIDRENPNVLSFEEVLAIDNQDLIFYQTQYKILASRTLALRVIEALNLKDNPEFKSDGRSTGFSIGYLLRSLRKSESKDFDNYEHKKKDFETSGLIDRYLARLKIMPIKGSRLVNVGFTGVNPEEIKMIVNRHANEYIDSNHEVRFAASNDAVEWLQKQILVKKELVEKAENTLQKYKEKKKIVSLEDRQNIIVQKLEDLNLKLTDARTDRMELETLYNLTEQYAGKQGMLETIPDIMENFLIQQLKNEHVSSFIEIKRLSKKYGKNHPAMIKAVTKAEEMKTKIDEEVAKIAKSIEAKYKVALSHEEGLSDALEEQKEVALKLNRDAIAYGTLRRDSEGERAMYEILLKRLKETDITGQLQTSNIRIVDLAEIPRIPIKPRKKKNVLLGALLGLVMGFCLAFFLEYIDNTLKKPEDVEQYLGIPLLGVIKRTRTQTGSSGLIVHELPKSVIAESFRIVRTIMMTSIVDNNIKLIMVTSAVQDEGKTFIASNLAYAIAKTGKKTLLVDSDLREPRLDKVFNVSREPGLSDHLTGTSYLESITKTTMTPNLSIITCGFIPPNPSEILESTVMEKFCNDVKYMFDIVVFDTPPSLTVTDALALSSKMDGVVITIKSGSTVKKAVKRCISQLVRSKCKILGAVINCANIVQEGSHYYRHISSSEKEFRDADRLSPFTESRFEC